MKNLLLVLYILILSSCTRQNENSVTSRPSIDYSTPDNTVRSLWKLGIWYDTTKIDTSRFEYLSRERVEKQRTKFAQEMEKLRKNHPYNKNQIIDVQIKSDSYALVESKEFSTYSNYIDDLHYILIKENQRWKVDDIQSKCYKCGGTGMEEDLEKKISDLRNGYISKPLKKCSICYGTGWRSIFNNE